MQASLPFDQASSGQAALGERLCFSLPVMSECGAPIYPSESKLVLRYYRRSKVGRGAQLNASLIDEALTAIRAPMALPFGAQPSSEPGGGMVSKFPSTSLLWRGFLLPNRVGGSSLSSAQSMGVKMGGVGAQPRLGGLPLLPSSLFFMNNNNFY
jgi:hypothetical protein